MDSIEKLQEKCNNLIVEKEQYLNDFIFVEAILNTIEEIIYKDKEPSDFMMSIPIVRAVYDLKIFGK